MPFSASASPQGERAVIPLNFAPDPGHSPVGILEAGEWVLNGPVRPDGYIDAVGRSAVWIGTEEGTLEAWIWPFKIFHAFNLSARTGEVGNETDLTGIARTVEVRPYGVQITFVHSRFTIRQTLLAHATEPVLVMLLEVDTSTDLTLTASFIPDLMPMWPAGMGGQYAYFDSGLPGYVLGESRGKVNAVVGSPDASRGSTAPAHQLAGANAFEISLPRERADSGPVILVVTGGQENRSDTVERYRNTAGREASLLQERKDSWAGGPGIANLRIPEEMLEEAYRWAVTSLVDGYQYSPELGTGLVAGFGPTGSGYRPGFSWYFGGDMSINSFGLVAAGQGWLVADAFRFLTKYQREDGKMMHELTRSAPLLDWFGKYPYAFIHGDTTPFYIVAFTNYYRWTGDRELLRSSFDNLTRAAEFCYWADEDGDGLMDNSRAGLGASELGSLREGLKTGVFIATVGTRALSDMSYLSREMGEVESADRYALDYEKAKRRLQELFVDPASRTLNFGVAVSGESKNDATAWAVFPIIFGLIGGEAAENTLDMVASARITTDWGTRMLAEDSPFYDPVGYNNGAVWPFLTGYVAMAEYAAGRRYTGYQHLLQVAGNTYIDALGHHPEVMSGDYFTVLETSVPHQLFSSSPIPANLIRGVLGLDIDLGKNQITVAPQLPGGWPGLALEEYPLEDGRFLDLEVHKKIEESQVQYELEVRGPEGLKIRFAPRPAPLESLKPAEGVEVELKRSGEARLRIEGRSGVDLVVDRIFWGSLEEGAVRCLPRQGDPPSGLRIIRVEERGSNRVELTLEGRRNYIYSIPIDTAHSLHIDGTPVVEARIVKLEDDYPHLQLSVGEGSGESVGVDDYIRFKLTIRID